MLCCLCRCGNANSAPNGIRGHFVYLPQNPYSALILDICCCRRPPRRPFDPSPVRTRDRTHFIHLLELVRCNLHPNMGRKDDQSQRLQFFRRIATFRWYVRLSGYHPWLWVHNGYILLAPTWKVSPHTPILRLFIAHENLADFILKSIRLLRTKSAFGCNCEPNHWGLHCKFEALAGYLLVDTCSAGSSSHLGLLFCRRDRVCARER